MRTNYAEHPNVSHSPSHTVKLSTSAETIFLTFPPLRHAPPRHVPPMPRHVPACALACLLTTLNDACARSVPHCVGSRRARAAHARTTPRQGP